MQALPHLILPEILWNWSSYYFGKQMKKLRLWKVNLPKFGVARTQPKISDLKAYGVLLTNNLHKVKSILPDSPFHPTVMCQEMGCGQEKRCWTAKDTRNQNLTTLCLYGVNCMHKTESSYSQPGHQQISPLTSTYWDGLKTNDKAKK